MDDQARIILCPCFGGMVQSLVDIWGIELVQSDFDETPCVVSDSFDVRCINIIYLWAGFTKGESKGCELKLEFSNDELVWYQEADEDEKPRTRILDDSVIKVFDISVVASFMRIGVRLL